MEPVLLKSYLAKSGDGNNVLLLFERKIIIVYRGATTSLEFEYLKGMNIVRKKLIIPLVMGGIGACLSWLLLSQGWYNYYLNLFAVFAFFCWMYYGYLGRDALEVQEPKHTHVFLISANHHVLNAFVKFTKERLWHVKQSVGQVSYHLASKAHWESQSQSEFYTHPSLKAVGFIHLSFASEVMTSYQKYFKPNDALVLIGVSHQRVEAEMKTEYVDERQAAFPHIYGPINKSAILHLRAIHGVEDLNRMFGGVV